MPHFGIAATAAAIACAVCVSALPTFGIAGESNFNVNDVSYLWPVPNNEAEVNRLISADELLADGSGAIWPADMFEAVIKQAGDIAVTNSAGRQNKIDFQPFSDAFIKPSTWKVVGCRFDPSGAGTNPEFIRAFGEIPQMRLVLQPVTMGGNGIPRIHDVTVHLVFSFLAPPAKQGSAFPTPDRGSFRLIVNDLKELKSGLEQSDIPTGGKLSVHPGFQKDTFGFTARVRPLLQKHLKGNKLSAVAFMGIDPPEPWIFFAMRRSGSDIKLQSFATLGHNSAEMLILRGGKPVIPIPVTTNVDSTRGVHTSLLFARMTKVQLDSPVFNDLPNLKFRDIPDVISNPTRSHFFNTDCVSCHTESSRRVVLGLEDYRGDFRFSPTDGMSSVDETLLPKNQWNVRNFGWFPTGSTGGVPTVTMRTANEAAESADFINRHYLNNGPTTTSQK